MYHAFFENFLAHRTEKLHSGSLRRFRSFLVFKKNWMEKKGDQNQDFLLIYFCFTVPKKFVREPFRVSKRYVVPKIFMQSRRASRFCQSLLSHRAKNFRGETFNVSEDLGHRLFLCINGQLNDFFSKNSNSQCRNISNRSRPRIQKNPGIEKIYA